MAFAVAPLLTLPPAAGGWRRHPRATPPRLVVVASTRDVDPAPPTFGQLREQLLQLHTEADLTQSKANSSRMRLVRLTEAAENLKRRAANSVRMGKEVEAVDLLVQKKKLTKALENIKERIEVLDKLSAKISEAISLKQNMLIQCALRPEMSDGENSDDNTRVFSSKINDGAEETERVFSSKIDEGADGTERVFSSKVNAGDDGTGSSDSHPRSVEKKFSEMRNETHANMAGHPEQRELQMADSSESLNEHDPINSIKDCSVYDVFLEHIDLRLKSLEYETEQFMSFQVVEGLDKEKQIDGKWRRLSDILKLVKETRERIARILDVTAEENETEDLR